MQIVEVQCHGADLGAAMTSVRTWLDHHQAEPSLFELVFRPVRFRLYFRDLSVASAFASAFDGELLLELDQAAAA